MDDQFNDDTDCVLVVRQELLHLVGLLLLRCGHTVHSGHRQLSRVAAQLYGLGRRPHLVHFFTVQDVLSTICVFL